MAIDPLDEDLPKEELRQEWTRKQELVDFLENRLQNSRTYVIGGAGYCDRYVTRQLKNGDWAGVTTYGFNQDEKR